MEAALVAHGRELRMARERAQTSSETSHNDSPPVSGSGSCVVQKEGVSGAVPESGEARTSAPAPEVVGVTPSMYPDDEDMSAGWFTCLPFCGKKGLSKGKSLYEEVLDEVDRSAHAPPKWRRMALALEMLMSFLVILSAVNMFAEVQIKGEDIAVFLETGVVRDESDSVFTYFRVFEQVVNVIFIVEIAIRLYTLKKRFFWDPVEHKVDNFNCLDLLIVIVCSIDLYVLPFAIGQNFRGNLQALRLARLLRLMRGLRVLRVMTAFSKLRVLLVTTASSFMSLFWSMILMGLIIYGSALSLCQVLQPVVEDISVPLELRLWVYEYYGSGSRVIWTLFLITFSGGWPNYVRRLIDEVHWIFALVFAIYVWVVVFAITRIITALFLRDTLQTASEDAAYMVREQRAARKRTMNKLQRLFNLVQRAAPGIITQDEFKAVCRQPLAQLYFNALDLKIGEACDLYSMLDDGDGVVSQDEFCVGILRLKGQARAVDVISNMNDCRQILRTVKGLENRIASIEGLTRSACDAMINSRVTGTV